MRRLRSSLHTSSWVAASLGKVVCDSSVLLPPSLSPNSLTSFGHCVCVCCVCVCVCVCVCACPAVTSISVWPTCQPPPASSRYGSCVWCAPAGGICGVLYQLTYARGFSVQFGDKWATTDNATGKRKTSEERDN